MTDYRNQSKIHRDNRILNIILLTVDALRPDHLSLYGYQRQTDQALEPYLDHMAILKNAYTYSPSTVRSFAATFCSIFPDMCVTKYPFEYIKKAWLPAFSCTLAEVFSRAGYYTAAHTCWVSFLSDRQGFGRGFNDFCGFLRQDGVESESIWREFLSKTLRYAQYGLRFVPSHRFVTVIESQFHWVRETINALGFQIEEAPGTGNRSGTVVTDYLLNCIKQHRGKPFFIWGHYLDTHLPFSPPKEFAYRPDIDSKTKRTIIDAIYHKKPISEPLRESLIDLYDGEVSSAFHQIRRMFDALKELGILEDTCVVITADHGQGFWEHGYWECPDDMFFDESIRVPLLIYNSALFNSQVSIEAPVSLINLAPTLIELCNLSPEDRFFGNSFSKLLQGESTGRTCNDIFIETIGPPKRYCIILNGKKAIYNFESASFLYGLNDIDRIVPIEQVGESLFRDCLRSYDAKKEHYLKRINREKD